LAVPEEVDPNRPTLAFQRWTLVSMIRPELLGPAAD
jgi:hypothetical protein